MASDSFSASRRRACPERTKPSNSRLSGGSARSGLFGPLRFSNAVAHLFHRDKAAMDERCQFTSHGT